MVAKVCNGFLGIVQFTSSTNQAQLIGQEGEPGGGNSISHPTARTTSKRPCAFMSTWGLISSLTFQDIGYPL